MSEEKRNMVLEAVTHMQVLNLKDSVIKEFQKNGKVGLSDKGKLTLLSEDTPQGKEVLSFIRDYELQTGNLVYHVIKNNTDYGIMWSFLYITKYSSEWEVCREYAKKNGFVFAYVFNQSYPTCSESGSIQVKINPESGALWRIA